jgi:hypothetical protein
MRAVHSFLAYFVAIAALAAGCGAGPEETRVGIAQPDEAAYDKLVHPVLEQACGSTDCHGKAPRGLRVYGAKALRLPNETGPTSAAEIRSTFESIIGLEPEKLNTFLASSPRSKDDAYHLLLLAKPLQLERHRGGISLRKGEPAEQCILSWLLGPTDEAACKAAPHP